MCILDFLFKKKKNKPETTPEAPQPALLAEFESLSEGLLFPSESDSPLISFFWDIDASEPLTEARVLAVLEKPADTPIRTQDIADFFSVVTPVRDFFDEVQREEAPKFQVLMDALLENLEDVRVFSVGEIEIQAFVVGRTRFGGFAGVSTILIET